MTQPHCVAVSRNTLKHHPFVRQVIPLGVDLATFHPGGTRRSVPVIVSVGALDGRKRGGQLLEWFTTAIRPRLPDAELHMVCRPGKVVPGVSYHTGISDDALAELYRSAWVYASASTYEGFGLPYLEAMACGLPVIATPNPGSAEVLDEGRAGVLASDDQFPSTLLRLLLNDDERTRWSAAGLARARECSLGGMIDRYEQLLSGLVNAPAAEPAA